MIEQAIYFGLGCVVAGLLALAFYPLLWARALRLTRQRLQVQIPVSMQEILADRDHLRAVFAVERRKLEQASERVRAGKAQDMAEMGRRAGTIAGLGDALDAAKATALALQAECDAAARAAIEANAERGALTIALHHTHGDLEQRLQDLEALRRAHARLEETLEERRTTIAALNTRVMGLEMTIEDAARARATADGRLDAAQRSLPLVTSERDQLAAQLVEAKARIRTLETVASSTEDVALAFKEREKGLYLEKSLQAEKIRGDGRATIEKLTGVQAENAALRGALEAARRREPCTGSPADGDLSDPAVADAILRTSIHDLGLAVARMTLATRSESQGKPETPASRASGPG